MILPRNLEAEASILGEAITEIGSAKKIFSILSPEDFSNSNNKAVADAIVKLLADGVTPDIVCLKAEIGEKRGIAAHLVRIVDSPLPSDVEHYCRVIKEKAIKRAIIAQAENLTKAALQGGDIGEEAGELVNTFQQIQQIQQDKQLSADFSNFQQDSAGFSKFSAEKTPFNLTATILEWINNSSGSFTVADIDREFCLTTRKQKNARASALKNIKNLNYIKVDSHFKGKYHILNKDLDIVDLDAPAEEAFPIHLPLNIHQKVVIPPNSIILLAGSSNAGKTAFALNTLYLNRDRDYKKLYLMSEMGAGEYTTRIKRFGPKQEWKSITAASRASDFEGAITHHNPSGLTVIDYIEETDGEYFRIPSTIRSVYDSLKNGVALICIQKASKSEIGRGGEGTLEKSRLYMTVDYLATGKHSIICALRLVKIKNFIGENLQNFEIHFRLSEGHKIDPLTNWMHCAGVDRDSYKRKYSNEIDKLPEKVSPGDVMLTLEDGSIKRIKEVDARRWQEEFFAVDVFAELRNLERETKMRSWLGKNYFFQVRGFLQKEQAKMEAANG